MSGHITRMSRGSSVGSSASRPSSTSRSTSTCRAGPWQACTWTLRSCGSIVRARRVEVALAAMSLLQPGEQGRGRFDPAVPRSPTSLLDDRRERALQLAHVATEGGEQRVADPLVGAVLAARHGAGRSVERVPERGRGVRQPEVHVAVLAERAEQLDLGDRDPGVAEQREPRRQVGPVGRRRAAASSTATCRSARRRRADCGGEQAPQLGLPGRSAATAPPAPSVSSPCSQSASRAAAARRTTRTGAPGAGPRRSDGRAAARPPRRSGRDRGGG